MDVDIWVMNADGSDQRMVIHLPGPSFAPYFQRMAGASSSPQLSPPEGYDFDLFLVNPDGTGLERVTTSNQFDAFSMFSPDGKQLVWVSGRGRKVPR